MLTVCVDGRNEKVTYGKRVVIKNKFVFVFLMAFFCGLI
jgi:hypothetical protein